MSNISGNHHLVWVFPEVLTKTLSAPTWLDTTYELRKIGWKVTLIIAGPSDLREIRGVEVQCIPKPNIYIFGQIIFHLSVLYLLIRQWNSIDVILFHQISAAWFFPVKIINRINGKRRPLVIMDTRSVPMTTDTFRDRVRELYYNYMNLLANRFTDGQTTITSQMAQLLHIPPEKLWGTWPSGVDYQKFSPAIDIRQWPSFTEPIQLIYIGVLSNERNLTQLYEALELANSEEMFFNLNLVGNGPARSHLEKIALSSAGRLRVLAPVPHKSVPDLLAKAHVGVLPFPDEEKFRVSSPIKLFEYMAAGLPVLATRIECHTDVICDGKFALWAEDASIECLFLALQRLWQSRDSLQILGQQAARASKAWSWNESAIKLSTALNQGITTSLQY